MINMKEFKTNPTVWSVDGNVIGEELGYLNNLPKYNSHFAKIVQGNPVNFGGYNHNSLVMTFDTDNLLDRETSRTLNVSKFTGLEATPTIVDSPDGSGEQVLRITPNNGQNWSLSEVGNPINQLSPMGLVAGNLVTLSADIWVPDSTGLNCDWAEGLKVGFRYVIGAGSQQFSYGQKATKTEEWERRYASFFLPSGITDFNFRLTNGFISSSKPVYFRRIKVQQRNICTPNQATGSDTFQTTSGFASNTATHSSSTEWSAEGSRSVKCIPSGAGGRVWIDLNTVMNEFKPGVTYWAQFKFKGINDGRSYTRQISWLNSPWTIILAESFTATGNTQTLTLPFTMPALIPGNRICLLIRDGLGDGQPFYVDEFQILKPITGFSPGVE